MPNATYADCNVLLYQEINYFAKTVKTNFQLITNNYSLITVSNYALSVTNKQITAAKRATASTKAATINIAPWIFPDASG